VAIDTSNRPGGAAGGGNVAAGAPFAEGSCISEGSRRILKASDLQAFLHCTMRGRALYSGPRGQV